MNRAAALLLALALCAPAIADEPEVTASNLPFATVAGSMTLAPAILESGGSLPGIMRVSAKAPVTIRLEAYVLKPGSSQQLPPRDTAKAEEPAQAPGGSLGAGIGEASAERPGSAEIVALLDVEKRDAEMVMTVKDREGLATATLATELPETEGRREVKAAAFAVTGDLGVRQPAWAFRIGGDGAAKAPAAGASTDADLRAFADGADALVVVFVTFAKAG